MERNAKIQAAISAAIYTYISAQRQASLIEDGQSISSQDQDVIMAKDRSLLGIRAGTNMWKVHGRQNIMDQRYMMQFKLYK